MLDFARARRLYEKCHKRRVFTMIFEISLPSARMIKKIRMQAFSTPFPQLRVELCKTTQAAHTSHNVTAATI